MSSYCQCRLRMCFSRGLPSCRLLTRIALGFTCSAAQPDLPALPDVDWRADELGCAPAGASRRRRAALSCCAAGSAAVSVVLSYAAAVHAAAVAAAAVAGVAVAVTAAVVCSVMHRAHSALLAYQADSAVRCCLAPAGLCCWEPACAQARVQGNGDEKYVHAVKTHLAAAAPAAGPACEGGMKRGCRTRAAKRSGAATGFEAACTCEHSPDVSGCLDSHQRLGEQSLPPSSWAA